MPVENQINDPRKDNPAKTENTTNPAVDALCSEAPDKEKCQEVVEKRLGQARDNINPSDDS